MKEYTIGFYLEKLYYAPHFEPIIDELARRGIPYTLVIPPTRSRDEVDQRTEAIQYAQSRGLTYTLEEEDCHCQWLIFGNNPHPLHVTFDRSALVMHGTWGGKAVYLDPVLNRVDVRFVDGTFMHDTLAQHFPADAHRLCISGYTKLDAYFRLTDADRRQFLLDRHLNPDKPTVLYAPTFYPSSILRLGKHFPADLLDYNLILKPHSHIFLRRRYRRDLRRVLSWTKASNVYLARFDETNLIPFFHAADLLISDISSAVFEFASLDKPVIINRFLHYRPLDRLFPRRISRRLDTDHFYLWDVGEQPHDYPTMLQAIQRNILHPDCHQAQRRQLAREVVGIVDGKASVRVVDRLLQP